LDGHSPTITQTTLGSEEPGSVAEILGNDGPFADCKPGFLARSEQQSLASALLKATF
jgi:hypothetical protein